MLKRVIFATLVLSVISSDVELPTYDDVDFDDIDMEIAEQYYLFHEAILSMLDETKE